MHNSWLDAQQEKCSVPFAPAVISQIQPYSIVEQKEDHSVTIYLHSWDVMYVRVECKM